MYLIHCCHNTMSTLRAPLMIALRFRGSCSSFPALIQLEASLKSSPSSSKLHFPFASKTLSSRPFSSSQSLNMAGKMTLMESIESRRSFYQINKNLPLSDDRVLELVHHTVKHVPSSFNSQSTRVVVLLKKEHDKFWDMVLEVLKPMVPAENFGSTEKKVSSFKAGYGTVRIREWK